MRRLALSLAAALGLLAAASACSSSAPGPEASSDDIIGGVDAKGAKLNAIGTVGRKGFDGSFDYFCTATLVAPNVVLTAKHCATRDPKSGRTMLDEDDVYFAVGPDSTKPLKTVKVKSVLTAPLHDGGFVSLGSDVAVYFLEEKIEDVTPLRIDGSLLNETKVGSKLTAVGFGIHDRDRNSGQRKAGQLTLQGVSGKPIQRVFPTYEAFTAFIAKHDGEDYVKQQEERLKKFYDMELLKGYEAYLGLGENDAQPCSGDSGGPLLARVGDENVVVAVVSGSFKGRTYPCSVVGEVYASFGPRVDDLFDSTAPECSGVPVWGTCDREGKVATRCVSKKEGPQRVNTIDCSVLGQACWVDAENKAYCDDPEGPAKPTPDGGAPDASDGGPSGDAGPG